MAKRDKRIAAMRLNRKNVRPNELDAVLRAVGFDVQRQTGSHKIYAREAVSLSIPQDKPFIKEVYVRLALSYVEDER